MAVYAVTGASGHLGASLSGTAEPRCARVRHRRHRVHRRLGRAPSGAGRAGVRSGLCMPGNLGPALASVNRLLLVLSRRRLLHHTNVISAAKTAGLSRIVYTSMLNADHTMPAEAPVIRTIP